jgi:hypothetical protein
MNSQGDRLTLGDLMRDKLESIKSQRLTAAAKKEAKSDD